MNQHLVIGLGELLWDCFGTERRPGGAPANVAFHAAQLGARGVICSRVGRDEPGETLIDYLTQRGLDTRYIQRDPRHPTGTVTVDASRPQHPSYVIHEHVAWDYLELTTDLASLAAEAAAVCFGTLAQRAEQSRATIETVLDHSNRALKVYDVNLRPPWYAAETIAASLRRCDVLKLNGDEVPLVAELLSLDAADPSQFAAALFARFDLRLVFVTRGAQGTAAISRDERVDVPGKQVAVVDTVGSGDAFTAALIHGLLNDWPLRRVARFANEVGALVASRAGAMPALREEFAALAARE